MVIYALHGFLGRTADWNCFASLSSQLIAVDLFHFDCPLEQWGSTFNATIDNTSILLGYSLGARLGMHALLANPTKWKGAIFVSGNPGLNCDEEKKKRFQLDVQWSKEFLEKPWEELMQRWNSLDVFCGVPNPLKRIETEFSRYCLAKSLVQWSVGYQQDLASKLQQIDKPILWITGSLDKKYSAWGNKMVFQHPLSQNIVVSGAAHRVPWEAPSVFENSVVSFIETLT